MSGVTLRYDGVGIGSNESFSVTSVSNKESFSKPSEVLQRETSYENFGNPCDLYSVGLDGSVVALPENPEYQALGIWSNAQTSENGAFSETIKISLIADEHFSTAGITLVFDTNKGIYANHLLIEWYRDNVLLSEKEFFPDNAEYFCSNRVDLYNRVDITFYGLNAPKNRLRLQGIEFGIVTEFTARVLKNSNIKHSLSPIAETLPINTLNFSIVSRDGISFVFQQRQPIEAYFNDKLKGQFFIRTATQSGANAYSVTCEDYVGLLENATFNGDIYAYANPAEVIREICKVAGVPVVVPQEYDRPKLLTGHIPRGTCRSALQQVLFSLQLIADTSNSRGLYIKTLQNKGQTIPRERIMQGINIKETDRVTAVALTAHSYIATDEEAVLYDAKESGTGDDIEVVFSEPYHGLTLTNGTFIEKSANHVVFSARANCVLTGKKYQHTTIVKQKKNPLLTATDRKNVLEITNATLVNADNVDFILNRCYTYLVNNRSISARIVEGKHDADNGYTYDEPISLADTLTLKTAFSGDVTAIVESQSFSMNGGILIKDTVLR